MSRKAGLYTQWERQLSLLTAIRRHSGITRELARRDIPAYADYATHEAFQRAFERDISDLRGAGYPISYEPANAPGGPHVYRIDRTAPIIAPLSALDVGLVRSVLSGMGKSPGVLTAAHTGLAKLLALSDSHVHASRFVKASIPSGDATSLARAIHYRQRVRFLYEGSGPEPSAYLLEPASLAEHFDAFYVSGLASRGDEDEQWELRTFRVSRIVNGSLSSLGSAEHATPPSGEDGQDVFTAQWAVLAIRPGCAQPLMSRGRACPPPAGASVPEGWLTVELSPVGKQRLYEDLALYGRDVKLLGEPDLVDEWHERLSHLANLGGGRQADGR